MKRKIYASYWILIVLLMLLATRPDLAATHAQQSNRAGLVVRFGDGSLTTRCVEFSESTISGYDLLTRSGLNIVAAFDAACEYGKYPLPELRGERYVDFITGLKLDSRHP